MFISFLLPFVDRGNGPIFHAVMLAQMSRFAPDEIAFVADAAYFLEDQIPFGRQLNLASFSFECIDRERFRAYRKHPIDASAVAHLYENGGSHFDAFRAILSHDDSSLADAIRLAAQDVSRGETIEAFLSWSNCPALARAASHFNAPVIYNEIGPLRAPAYEDTYYFDFSGVNGNSTPAASWHGRFLHDQFAGQELLSPSRLRGLFAKARPEVDQGSRYPIGVALQVEDDSNLVAYSNGFDSVSLLYRALMEHDPADVLVRSHPSAHFLYTGGLGAVDVSKTAIDFLGKIDRLLTINSSMAAEALFWEVPFKSYGDSPISLFSDRVSSQSEMTVALNAFFVGYLIPPACFLDPAYYRWRLQNPSLRECFTRHLGAMSGRETGIAALRGPADQSAAGRVQSDGTLPLRTSPPWIRRRETVRGERSSFRHDIESLRSEIHEYQNQILQAARTQAEQQAAIDKLQNVGRHYSETNRELFRQVSEIRQEGGKAWRELIEALQQENRALLAQAAQYGTQVREASIAQDQMSAAIRVLENELRAYRRQAVEYESQIRDAIRVQQEQDRVIATLHRQLFEAGEDSAT